MIKGKILKIYLKESDKYKGKLLYKYILDLLQLNKIKGATVFKGIYGYGERGVSEIDVFRLSLDLPLLIECIDEEEKINGVIPKIKEVIKENGLIVVADCFIVK